MDPQVVDLTQDDTQVIITITSPPPRKAIEVVEVSDTEEQTDENRPVQGAPRRQSLTQAREQERRRRSVPECPICIEPFQNVKRRGDKCVVTACGHLFCDSCLRTSLQHQAGVKRCPKCRKTLPKTTPFIQVYDIC